MLTKIIDFETLKESCKHKEENSDKCDEEDNFSGCCDCRECPIWCDLINNDTEL